MKLLKTIHRSSGHSAKIYYNNDSNDYLVKFYISGNPIHFEETSLMSLQGAIMQAEIELNMFQDMDD